MASMSGVEASRLLDFLAQSVAPAPPPSPTPPLPTTPPIVPGSTKGNQRPLVVFVLLDGTRVVAHPLGKYTLDLHFEIVEGEGRRSNTRRAVNTHRGWVTYRDDRWTIDLFCTYAESRTKNDRPVYAFTEIPYAPVEWVEQCRMLGPDYQPIRF